MKKVSAELGIEIAGKLSRAAGDERARVIQGYLSVLGWSRGKLYRVAAEYGFKTFKKPRCDKGVVKAAVDTQTVMVGAALIMGSKRLTDKITMPTWKTLEILGDNGKLAGEVSPSWFNRQLRRHKVSGVDIKKPTAAISLASKHPNHVHQMDFSVCIQYDFKEQGTKWKMVDRDMQKAFYKNKPGYWKEVKKVLIRAMMTDHCSGTFFPKYYYVAGENTEMIVDFILSAWERKEDAVSYPFCGVPQILMMDPGSANTGQVITNLLKNLRVKPEVHFPGHARVKGQVESMHGYWEEAFESELSLKKAMDIIELNARTHDYAAYLNTAKKHKRHGQARFAVWQTIGQEQLRLLPPREVCLGLCDYDPVQASVNNLKCIQCDGRHYLVKGPFRSGDKVWVIKNPYQEPFIEVSDKKEGGEFFRVELIRTDKYGFNVDAAIIGEGYKSHPDDATAKFMKAVEKKEISLDGIEPKLQREKIMDVAFITRTGTEVAVDGLPRAGTGAQGCAGAGVEVDGSVAPALPCAHAPTPRQPEPCITYTSHEVYREIRYRAKLDRITPLQSQCVDEMLAGRERVEESVIEDIMRVVFKQQEVVEVSRLTLQVCS